MLPLLLLALGVWGQINPTQMRGGLNNISNINPNRNNNGNNNIPNNSNNADTASKSNEEIGGIEYHEEIPDSVLQASVIMFHRDPVRVKIMAVEFPTLTPTGAQFHDRLDAFNGDYYLTVSDLGHQHYSIFPSFSATPGLIYKSNLFPGFYKTPDKIVFYQAKTPYALLSYNTSLNNDYQVHFTHTQNINSHWNYALDYHLICPKGTFANSAAKDHLLDITTNYYSADARYQLSAGFIWQNFVMGENGGLSNPQIYFNKPNANTTGLPVLFNNRISSTNDVTVFVRQSYNTVHQFEWYRPIKQNFVDTTTLYDTIRISYFDSIKNDTLIRDSITASYQFRVYDSIVAYDTILPHAPHSYNTGVLSLDIQWDRQKYRCIDSTQYNQLSADIFWTNDAYMDHRWHNPVKIYGGIRPQASWLELNPAEYTTPNISQFALYPFGRLEISPWPATELKVYGEASPNLAEYNLDANLLFPFRDSIGNSRQNISLHAVVKAYYPELIYYTECNHINRPISSQFNTIGVRKLEADYHREGLLDIHISANHISHNIWFEKRDFSGNGTGFVPVQSNNSALLLQARANLYLKLGSVFHYDMQHLLQWSSDQDQVRVPLFASKNSIYADFSLFNNALRAQVGVDIRYHTQFLADGYDPVLGIFYRQNETSVGNYLWADVFVNLQIKRATIYAKAGHLNSLIEQHHYFIIPDYPAKQFGVFFGLTWKFFD